MIRIACLALVVGVLIGRPVDAAAADLRVVVEGLRSDKGHVNLGLYDDPDKFPGRAGVIQSGRAKIQAGRAEFTFRDLKPGRYAVSLFHDENDDGQFNRSLIGLPLEGYGFSNNPRVVLSAPSFDACAVAVGQAGAETTVKIAY
jgi:uncharacterized protein (DUF2141 family)